MGWDWQQLSNLLNRGNSNYYGRSKETINRALNQLGERAHGIVSNAGNMSDIMNLQTEVKKYTEQIDLLFPNAGYGKPAPIEFVEESQFDEIFNMLVKGTFSRYNRYYR